MLESIGKVYFVKEVIEEAKVIIKFIYDHALVISLMMTSMGNKELVHLAITHFAISFIFLQCTSIVNW
jgi:hypothetical protein